MSVGGREGHTQSVHGRWVAELDQRKAPRAVEKDCDGIWERLKFPLAEGEGVLGALPGQSLPELGFERRIEFVNPMGWGRASRRLKRRASWGAGTYVQRHTAAWQVRGYVFSAQNGAR